MKSNLFCKFRPEFFESIKTYNKDKFVSDLMSGAIVGIVALPLAIAFAIASGVSPEKGLYTAIVAGFIISLLGGSNVQIGGPTGAFVVIISGIVAQYGLQGLAIATVIAGLLLVLMGILRMGLVIKFMPYPIIVGFTSGIALIIFTTQIKDLFGLTIRQVPADFIEKWGSYFSNFNTINWWACLIGILSIAIIQLTPRILKKIPGSLFAIVICSILAYALKEYAGITSIETIGDRFEIASGPPQIQNVPISLDSIRLLFPAAFTIAILGAVESLLSATVADGVTGKKHHSNTELIAQGVANIASPFFGGIPATGAIARTMTNINNGGNTPVAGMIHALVLLLILLFLSDLTKLIPMSCLAGVLVVVAYNMSEWRNFLGVMRGAKSDMAVLFTTFILTVVFDLTIAIEVGLVLAIFVFMKRMTDVTEISVEKEKLDLSHDSEIVHEDEVLEIPKNVEVYEINGPFFFGIANKFDEEMRQLGDRPQIRIIRMRRVPFIDSTGLHNLETLCKKSRNEKTQIILSGVNPKVEAALEKAHFGSLLGKENICENIHIALARANFILQNEK
ncbi:MAG: sulfate transporter [Bacteroidetes bacterium]|jgi:sulfate permease, SulP family|nr:sulfate transporter [Bacteroidota bacterium]